MPIFQQGRNGLEGWFEFCFIVDFPQNFALSFDRIYAKQVFLFFARNAVDTGYEEGDSKQRRESEERPFFAERT